jgi:hypothetical protein
VTRGAWVAGALLAVLAGCGVKAPPRASGVPDRSPPNQLFRPHDEPGRPGADPVTEDEEAAEPSATPAAPSGEPAR